MTRKDYVAIAAAFKLCLDNRRQAQAETGMFAEQIAGFIDAVNITAAVFAADNPRFDRERFLKACGVQS
jgi:hypothetical protein